MKNIKNCFIDSAIMITNEEETEKIFLASGMDVTIKYNSADDSCGGTVSGMIDYVDKEHIVIIDQGFISIESIDEITINDEIGQITNNICNMTINVSDKVKMKEFVEEFKKWSTINIV